MPECHANLVLVLVLQCYAMFLGLACIVTPVLSLSIRDRKIEVTSVASEIAQLHVYYTHIRGFWFD